MTRDDVAQAVSTETIDLAGHADDVSDEQWYALCRDAVEQICRSYEADGLSPEGSPELWVYVVARATVQVLTSR